MKSNAANSAELLFTCAGCGRASPQPGFSFICDRCGGIYDDAQPLVYLPPDTAIRSGIGRYRHSFPLDRHSEFVSLGEGNTPLLGIERGSRTIHLKCEGQNPTGSFKDRGSAILLSALKAAGVDQAVEDSSGNAGASFAAYASRAGIKATVYVPEYASGPKKAQIEAYGARVVPIPGPRSAVSEAVQRGVNETLIYASHSYLPHGIAGMATIAFELVEQLGRAPGAVLMPVGQGTLFLGLYRGLRALQTAGLIEDLPQLVGVQALACAPIWAAFTAGATGHELVDEGETIAEGIRIVHPLRSSLILEALKETRGRMIAVEESQILPARDQLASHGLYVEPTSAVVWAALEQCLHELPDPIVLVLTGNGLKSPRS